MTWTQDNLNIVDDCEVHVLSELFLFDHPKYVLPDDGTQAERMIAMGGKVCYDTYGTDGNPVKNHVMNLVSQAHFSVIEHVNVTVLITGISRGCSHEIVRHRHFSYSQRSTRYTAEEGAAIVLEPFIADIRRQARDANIALGINPPSSAQIKILYEYLSSAADALNAYSAITELLLDQAPVHLSPRDRRKWARGKSRQRLPHDLETRMVMTGNLRAWREFLVKRTSRHAEAEIRRLAEKLYNVLIPIAPMAFTGLQSSHVEGYIEVVEKSK